MSNSTKSPSPTKISPKKTAQEFQAASEAVELEYNAVKRLKRLSIGNSLNFDPDLPPTDPYLLDQQQKSISSSLDVNRSKSIHSVSSLNKSFNNYQYNDDDQNSGYEYSTASLNDSYTNDSDIGNHSISLSNKSIGEGLINFNDGDNDDDDLDDNVDFLDLDPDSSFNDSDIMWVPANAHPKLSPQNFRKHIQETVDGINTKLKRSGSIKSSLNYDSTDASDSSTADVNSNIRKPSLKELTLQLESLSKKAGLDNSDPVTLARSLSTRSIGISKIERDYSTDNSDDSGTESNIYRAKSRKLLLNKNTSKTRESLFIKDIDDFTNLDGEDKNEDEEAYIEMNKSTSSINSNPPDFVSNLKRGRWTNYRRQQSAKQNDAVDSTDKPSLPALPNQSNSVSANFNRTHVYKDIQKVYNAQKPLGRPQLEPIKLRTPSSKLPDVPSQPNSTATENALLSDYPKRSKESLPQRPQQQQQQQHYQNNHGRQPVAQNQQYTHIQKQQQLQSAQHQIPHRHHRRAHPNQHLNQQQFQNQQYQQDLNSRHRMPQNNGYNYKHHHQQQQQQQQQQLQIPHRDRDRDRDSDRQQHSQQMDPNPRPLQIAPQTTQKQPRQQPQPQSHRSQAASSAAFVSQNAAVGHPSASSLTSPTTKEFFDNNKNLRSSPTSTSSLAPNKSNKPVISQAQPTLPKQKPVSSSPILSAAFSASKAVSTPSSPRLTSTDSEVTKVSSEIDQLDLNKTAVKVPAVKAPAVKVSSGPLEVEKNREKDSEKSTSKGKSFTSFFKIKRDKSSQRSASLALDEPKKLKVKRSLSHSSESSGLSSPKSDFKSFFSKKDKDDKGKSKERETSKEKERETEKEKEKENVKPRHSTDKPSSSTPSPKLGIGLFSLTKNKSSDNVAIEDKNKSVRNSQDDVRKESGTEKTKAKSKEKEKEKEQFQEQEQDKVKPSRFGLSRSSSSDFNRGEVLAETGYARNAEDRGNRVTGADTGTGTGTGTGTEIDQNKPADGRSVTAAVLDHKLHVESDHSSSGDPVLETYGSFSSSKNEYAVASAVSRASSPNADSSTSSPDGTKKIAVPFTQNKDSSAAKSTAESPETKPEAPADSATDANDLVKKSLRETLERNERPQKPNQPLEMKDSAFGFPLPPVSQSTLVMLDHRLPVHIERAIYRLSHLKLADPKRQLRQQVLLSNFMYSYLNLVNHTLWIQSKEQETDQQDETDAANGEKATVSGTSISVS